MARDGAGGVTRSYVGAEVTGYRILMRTGEVSSSVVPSLILDFQFGNKTKSTTLQEVIGATEDTPVRFRIELKEILSARMVYAPYSELDGLIEGVEQQVGFSGRVVLEHISRRHGDVIVTLMGKLKKR